MSSLRPESGKIPDFDQLPSGDHNLTAPGKGVENQEHRSCIVIYDQGGFGAGQFAKDRLGVNVSGAPFAQFEVVFEVAVAAANCQKSRDGFFGEK